MAASQAAREAIEAFFADCGVTAVLAPEPVDRFAERPPGGEAEVSAGPAKQDAASGRKRTETGASRRRQQGGAEAPHPATRQSSPGSPAPDLAAGGGRVAGAPAREGVVEDAREAARAATSLEELARAREAFEGCALKATAKRTVQGEGPVGAPLMLVGEAPGAEEDRAGRPFVGRSGQLLDKMLAAIGWPRESVYVTNVIPWRPPFNRTPSPIETEACAVFVRREIALVGPRILVPMGGAAAKTLLATDMGIMSLRGRWAQYVGAPNFSDATPLDAMPIFHPAFLLRTPAQKKAAWRDLLAIAERLSASGVVSPGDR